MNIFTPSTQIAAELKWKHGRLLRIIDRVIKILPPDFTGPRFKRRDTTGSNGNTRKIIEIRHDALPFVFAEQATKKEILWLMSAIKLNFAVMPVTLENNNDCMGIYTGAYNNYTALCVKGTVTLSHPEGITP